MTFKNTIGSVLLIAACVFAITNIAHADTLSNQINQILTDVAKEQNIPIENMIDSQLGSAIQWILIVNLALSPMILQAVRYAIGALCLFFLYEVIMYSLGFMKENFATHGDNSSLIFVVFLILAIITLLSLMIGVSLFKPMEMAYETIHPTFAHNVTIT